MEEKQAKRSVLIMAPKPWKQTPYPIRFQAESLSERPRGNGVLGAVYMEASQPAYPGWMKLARPPEILVKQDFHTKS